MPFEYLLKKNRLIILNLTKRNVTYTGFIRLLITLIVRGGRMEERIKKIIEIDQDAVNYQRIKKELIRNKKQDFEKEMRDTIENNKQLIETEKQKIREEEMAYVKDEISKFKEGAEKKLQEDRDLFSKIKEELEVTAFNKLIKDFQEV